MESQYLLGTGIYDITGPAAELGMMGMSNLNQKTTGIHTRLFAKSFIICDKRTDKRVVILCADLWSCTQAVKMEVIKRLKVKYRELYTADNVLICGTHTHSGPGGYSHYALFNLTILGFDKQNFEVIVSGMVESIKIAHNNLAPGKIYVDKSDVDNCGWNRSEPAYLNNPKEERDHYNCETDKEMLLLKFVTDDGTEIGCLNWFAIHPTSLGEKNELISGDNKRFASYLFEKDICSRPNQKGTFVAAFANSNCGDVSGNVKYGVPDGIHDFAHMEEFGGIQYENARELFDSTDKEELSGSIDYRHKYINMSDIKIEGTKFKTYPAALGVSMVAGSSVDSTSQFGVKEGVTKSPDNVLPEYAHVPALFLIRGATALVEGIEFPEELTKEFCDGHGNKPIIIAQGLTKPYPLTPEILPIQIIKIGNLAVLGIPGEITTMAGRRLKKIISDKLSGIGVKNIALGTYSNAYSGYITTKEEYDMQHYEGASTHFGPYTLMAYQQEFSKLADTLVNGKEVEPGPNPRDLSDKQISLQTGVVFDTKPFGKIHQDVKSAYKIGDTVEVVFWGAHPKNNLRTGDTFLKVEKKEGGNWKTLFTDQDTCTIYRWSRYFVTNSLISITWNIPADTKPGEYRISHFGNWKGIDGKITPYSGVSGTFKI